MPSKKSSIEDSIVEEAVAITAPNAPNSGIKSTLRIILIDSETIETGKLYKLKL